MTIPREEHTKVILSGRKNRQFICHICEIRKSIQINLYMKQNSLTDKKQTYDYQRGEGGGRIN